MWPSGSCPWISVSIVLMRSSASLQSRQSVTQACSAQLSLLARFSPAVHVLSADGVDRQLWTSDELACTSNHE